MSCLDEGVSASLGGVEFLTVHSVVDVSMLAAIIVSNSLIISAVALYGKRLRLGASPVSGRFIANLAAADTYVALATLYFQSPYYLCSARRFFNSYQLACVFRYVLICSAHMVSAYSLAAIAIDRYFAVVHALRYRELLNSRRCSMLISGVWACALGTGLILVAWNHWEPGGGCELEQVLPPLFVYTVGMMTHGTLFTVVAAVHYRIHREAMAVSQRRRSRESGSAIWASNDNIPSRINTKSARVVLLVTGVYLICWTPYTIVYMLHNASSIRTPLTVLFSNVFLTFANINYLVNPFIYSWKNAVVKAAIHRLLAEVGLIKKPKRMFGYSISISGQVPQKKVPADNPS